MVGMAYHGVLYQLLVLSSSVQSHLDHQVSLIRDVSIRVILILGVRYVLHLRGRCRPFSSKCFVNPIVEFLYLMFIQFVEESKREVSHGFFSMRYFEMYPAIHLSVESLTSGQSLFVQGAAIAAIAIPQYDELFGKNLDQKLAVVHLLKRNLEERNKILKEQE